VEPGPHHFDDMKLRILQQISPQQPDLHEFCHDLIAANRAQIAQNRVALFNAECAVMENRSNAYLARSLVQENHGMILNNYQAAFMGNRQLANQNTDDLFRNRYAIVRRLQADTPVAKNFKEAKTNEAKIFFLEHRSRLNTKLLDITLRMAAVNSLLIEINRDIMQSNEEIVRFNSQCIEENAEMIKNGLNAAAATPESNAALITSNASRIDVIRSRAADNASKVVLALAEAEHNRSNIQENTESIYARRGRMQSNHDKIRANQAAVAKFVGEF